MSNIQLTLLAKGTSMHVGHIMAP